MAAGGGVTEEVVAALAGPVAAAVPVIAGWIPARPAAALGRLGVPPETGMPVNAGAGETGLAESSVAGALGALGPLLAERLLGALELAVPGLDLAGGPDLSHYLGQPEPERFAIALAAPESEALTAVTMLEQLRPGALDLVASLTRQLAGHPEVAPVLAAAPDAPDEASIAAAHGAAYLALAVAVASAALGRLRTPRPADSPAAAVVGAAIGAAALLLRETPMPGAYAAALLARARAEYLLPLRAYGSVPVSGHQFGLVEGEVPEVTDFGGNGLVAAVAGGAVIRTGTAEGRVRVYLAVLAQPPPTVEPGWDEVVEVSWHAAAGQASVAGPAGPGDDNLLRATPPWPGDYRLRVHARGRDDADEEGEDEYQLEVWQAPAGPEIVHHRADQLGHRLRGEPEPARPGRPEHAYRWIRDSALDVAATVTAATGLTVEEVLRAFGADPARPESLRGLDDEVTARMSIDPWVAVLDIGNAVLAVEYNGWQGAQEPVLLRASAGGRAASMYWNVNAVTRLSFAEGGRLLASFEPPYEDVIDAGPAVAAALAGLDFDDYRDKTGKGLAAVERFTGRGITAEDLRRIEAADIAFRIVPDLPSLYPYQPPPAGAPPLRTDEPPGPDPAALAELPEPRLRDLAWWVAAEAARYAGVADDPDIAASIAARALTAGAQRRARRSQLDGGEHPWVWLALHRATNPDPVAGVIEAVDAARFAAGPHAAELVQDARRRAG
jgi:Family of unknown function (DUF6461)